MKAFEFQWEIPNEESGLSKFGTVIVLAVDYGSAFMRGMEHIRELNINSPWSISVQEMGDGVVAV